MVSIALVGDKLVRNLECVDSIVFGDIKNEICSKLEVSEKLNGTRVGIDLREIKSINIDGKKFRVELPKPVVKAPVPKPVAVVNKPLPPANPIKK